MDKTGNIEITYGRLNDALLSLGFRRVDGRPETAPLEGHDEIVARIGYDPLQTPYTAYFNEEYDASIILPVVAPSQTVRPLHFAAARSGVVSHGILSEAAWQKLLLAKPPASRRAKKAKSVPAESA